MSTQSYRRAFMLVAATACWGTGTVVTKQVLGSVQPLTLLPLQLAASCLLLLVALRLSGTKFGWSPQMTPLTLLGILNPGTAYALGLLGLASISASMSVLLWALEPMLILVLAVALLREHIPLALAAAVAVAVLGVLLVVHQPGATGDALGIALTMAAVGACATYTILTRRLLIDDASLPVVLSQQAAALGFAVALATVVELAGGSGWSMASLTPTAWAGAAASGVLYYGAAFWFYLAGLRQVPASVAGAFLPLIPVFGVAAAYLTGDRLDVRQWLGAALIVGATGLVATRQITQPSEAAATV